MHVRNGKKIVLPTGDSYGISDEGVIYNTMCPDGVSGVNYPRGAGPLASEEGMASLGITEVPDPIRPSDIYYWVIENEDGTFSKQPKDHTQIVNMVWGQIKEHRDRLLEGGIKVGKYWFHNDTRSQVLWNRMLQLSSDLAKTQIYYAGGYPLEWKTMSGELVPVNVCLVRKINEALEAQEVKIFMTAEGHKQKLLEMTVEEIEHYNWREGWPETYSGN